MSLAGRFLSDGVVSSCGLCQSPQHEIERTCTRLGRSPILVWRASYRRESICRLKTTSSLDGTEEARSGELTEETNFTSLICGVDSSSSLGKTTLGWATPNIPGLSPKKCHGLKRKKSSANNHRCVPLINYFIDYYLLCTMSPGAKYFLRRGLPTFSSHSA